MKKPRSKETPTNTIETLLKRIKDLESELEHSKMMAQIEIGGPSEKQRAAE